MSKLVGDRGEVLAAEMLRARGYDVVWLGGNYPTIDLRAHGLGDEFGVSVKTSASKQHVRLGRPQSIERLASTDFVFAFLPRLGSAPEDIEGDPDLLIIPGDVVKRDALWVHHSYIAGAGQRERKGSAGVIVKGYSRRPEQKQVWARWTAAYRSRWDLLPPPRGPKGPR